MRRLIRPPDGSTTSIINVNSENSDSEVWASIELLIDPSDAVRLTGYRLPTFLRLL